MMDAQPASAVPHPAETGWSFHCAEQSEWEKISGDGALTKYTHHLSAFVAARATAQWALITEPIWVYHFSSVRIKYRARGIAPGANLPILQLHSGSTGPVTPGANNIENPLTRAGAASILSSSDLISDGELHELTTQVYPPIQTEQIDQIILTLQTGDQPGLFEIHEFSFFDPNAKRQPIFSCLALSAAGNLDDAPSLRFLRIHESPYLLVDLADGADGLHRDVRCAGIPFRLNSTQSIAVTSLAERDTIILDVNERCSQLFLLMAANLVGTDGAFHFTPRAQITLPERFIITKVYDDDTFDRSFPYHLAGKAHIVDTTMNAYAVPADANKRLKQIRIEERMPYGQIFLAAATAVCSTEPYIEIPKKRFAVSLPAPIPTPTGKNPTLTVEKDRKFTLENSVYKLEMNAENGLQLVSLLHKPLDKNILLHSSPIFTITVGGTAVPTHHFQLQTYKTESNMLELHWKVIEEPFDMLATLHMSADETSLCTMALQITNSGYTPQSIRVRFPDLEGIRLSRDSNDDFYLFPLMRTAWGNENIRLNGVHSGEFPLQFMDLYSESLAGGLALHTRGKELVLKRFSLEKTDAGTKMGIDYGFSTPIELGGKESFQTLPTVIEFHHGDWHTPFHTYKQWLHSWYSPRSAARQVLKNVFICRRDYPIGGTGYLFDPYHQSYTFSRLIGESRETLGGVDMIDISGWAYSETRGRVGEYHRYELGGCENLHGGIEQSHRGGVPVGLYLEGYLIDPRSEIGSKRARDWQIIGRDGNPKTWQGNEEMFMCSYAPDWRDFMGKTLLRAAQETGADALYIDQYGFSDAGKTCYSDHHSHEIGAHPLLGEHEMLKQVRAMLDQCDHPVALYVEQVPNDISSQFTEAAFDYGMTGNRPFSAPGKLNLFRFAVPDYKIIELFHPGIDPKGASAEDAKLCLFHGKAMWLKGRAKSWYSREFREFTQTAWQLFHDHIDAFTSKDAEVFIPVAQAGLYANRFSSKKETVVTLYNAQYDTISGLLLHTNGKPKMEKQNGIRDVFIETTTNETLLYGKLDPHDVGVIILKNDRVE
jgi:hypothetical protein